jgi:uncharacterized protein (DUF305 family)
MFPARPRMLAAPALILLVGLTSLAAAPAASRGDAATQTPAASVARAGATYVQADVDFMSGMIPHHAQAVLMAGWAASHGARDDVRILCERIVVGQRDEIKMMQEWLRDRGEVVPSATDWHMKMMMDGMEHDMLMPGMLSDAEMKTLDAARGSVWDRLFLEGMIKHHQGALSMVDTLFKSKGAAQDDVIFRFASDVYADQGTEIARMNQMLSTVPPLKGGVPTR